MQEENEASYKKKHKEASDMENKHTSVGSRIRTKISYISKVHQTINVPRHFRLPNKMHKSTSEDWEPNACWQETIGVHVDSCSLPLVAAAKQLSYIHTIKLFPARHQRLTEFHFVFAFFSTGRFTYK